MNSVEIEERLFDASQEAKSQAGFGSLRLSANLDPVGRPICGANYQHRLDPFGFDGPWWWDHYCVDGISCEHAQTIRSAYRGVDLMELKHDENMLSAWTRVPMSFSHLGYGFDGLCGITKITRQRRPFIQLVYFSVRHPEGSASGGTAVRCLGTREYNVGYDPRMHWDFDLMLGGGRQSALLCS